MDKQSRVKEVENMANKASESFKQLVKTIARLRDPQNGCPWDLKQTNKSLIRYMLEEAYECATTMAGEDTLHLVEELGDVLLQVVLNAQILKDEKKSEISEVINNINEKMIRRHPHVFENNQRNISEEQLHLQWAKIKESEAKKKSDSVFHEVEKVIPSTTQAFKIGKIAQKIRFDWDKPHQVLSKLKEEINELESELSKNCLDENKISNELGDIYFTLAQLTRHLGFEPEAVSLLGNQKFLKRFKIIEQNLSQRSQVIGSQSQHQLEQLWLEAKKQESK